MDERLVDVMKYLTPYGIFIPIQSLEKWPTKAKEAPIAIKSIIYLHFFVICLFQDQV